MERHWLMSYCTQNIDGTSKMGCAIVTANPLKVIQNYNNQLSSGVKNHVLISWQELSVEDIQYATFSSF